MPEFIIVKTVRPNGDDQFIGFTPDDHKKYVHFRDKSRGMEAGEYVKVKVSYPRDVVHHKRMMALLRFGFEQWEPQLARKRQTYKGLEIHKDFEHFRKDMVILAGYGEAKYEVVKGRTRVTMDARSMAFDSMSEDDAQALYAALYTVIFEHILEPKGYTHEVTSDVLDKYQNFQPT